MNALCRPVEEGPVQSERTPPIHEVQHEPLRGGASPVLLRDVELRRKLPFPVIECQTVLVHRNQSKMTGGQETPALNFCDLLLYLRGIRSS